MKLMIQLSISVFYILPPFRTDHHVLNKNWTEIINFFELTHRNDPQWFGLRIQIKDEWFSFAANNGFGMKKAVPYKVMEKMNIWLEMQAPYYWKP